VYEYDIKKADVVFAHPHKTKIKRYHPNQKWVSQFWESEGIYPDINTEKFDAFKSYRQDATFPCYAMITDTFKPEKMIEPLPYEKKINIEWMSVWLSNCRGSGRNSMLKKLQKEGITGGTVGLFNIHVYLKCGSFYFLLWLVQNHWNKCTTYDINESRNQYPMY